MKLDAKDIEAVANSRVRRADGNKSTYWVIGSVIAMTVGMFVIKSSVAPGLVLFGVGAVAFIGQWRESSKKQNAAKKRLLAEWQQEQKLGVDKTLKQASGQ